MSPASPTYPCPKGHASAEPDYCDTCGAAIAGAPPPASSTGRPASPVDPGPAAAPAPAGPVQTCPVCSTPRSGSDRFCENDGYDFTTGRRPDPDPGAGPPPAAQAPASAAPPSAAPAINSSPTTDPWTASVDADRAYFERNATEGVDFPPVCPTRTFTLDAAVIRVGRRSTTKGIAPEMDLSGPPLDPGISHLHAVLAATGDGWTVTDPGSTNGTTMNDSPTPLAVSAAVAVADGDRVHLGAWTTITLHAPSSRGRAATVS